MIFSLEMGLDYVLYTGLFQNINKYRNLSNITQFFDFHFQVVSFMIIEHGLSVISPKCGVLLAIYYLFIY